MVMVLHLLQLSRVEAAVETAAAAGQPVSNLQLSPTALGSGLLRPSEEITVKLDNFGATPMDFFVTVTEHEAEQGGSLCPTGHFAPEAQMQKMEYHYHHHSGEQEATELPEVEATELPEVEVTELAEVEATEGPEVEGTEGAEVEGTEGPEIEATELPELEATEGPEGTEAPEQEYYTAVELGAPAAGAATTCATVVTGSVEGSAAVSANFTAGACGCYVV